MWLACVQMPPPLRGGGVCTQASIWLARWKKENNQNLLKSLQSPRLKQS